MTPEWMQAQVGDSCDLEAIAAPIVAIFSAGSCTCAFKAAESQAVAGDVASLQAEARFSGHHFL